MTCKRIADPAEEVSNWPRAWSRCCWRPPVPGLLREIQMATRTSMFWRYHPPTTTVRSVIHSRKPAGTGHFLPSRSRVSSDSATPIRRHRTAGSTRSAVGSAASFVLTGNAGHSRLTAAEWRLGGRTKLPATSDVPHLRAAHCCSCLVMEWSRIEGECGDRAQVRPVSDLPEPARPEGRFGRVGHGQPTAGSARQSSMEA